MSFAHPSCLYRQLLGLLALLAAAVCGCSEESRPTPDAGTHDAAPDMRPGDLALHDLAPPETGPDAEQPDADLLLEALCALVQRCQTTLGPAFASELNCQRHFARRYSCGRDPAAINRAARDRCLGWLEQLSCEDEAVRFGCVALSRPLGCSDPLQQWGRLGAPGCAHVYAAPAASLDDSCETLPCDEGLYCRRGATKAICPVCRPLAAQGEACLENPILPSHLPCTGGLTCGAERRCVPRFALQASCERDSQCQSGFCRAGSCAAPLEPGDYADLYALDQCAGFWVWRDDSCAARQPQGEACTYDVDCLLDSVCEGGSCKLRDVCARRQPGEPCVTEPLGCVPGSFCNNTASPQTCESTRALGASCEFTEDCGDEAYCSFEEQLCTAYATTGQSCAGFLLCALDHYCDEQAGSLCALKLADSSSCDYGYQCLSGTCDPASGQCAAQPPCTMP